jgi:hypothetical protein
MSRNNKNRSFSQPPQRVAAFHGTHTIRYSHASAGAQSIQIADLQDAVVVATAATTAYRLFDAIRIKKIEIWAAAAAGSNTAVLLEELQSSASFLMASKSRSIEDMVVGTARAAHIVYKPSAGSIQGNWISANISAAVNILTVTAPAGAVMDFTFDYTLADGNQAPTAGATAISGATAGQVYTRAFGVSSSTTAWAPVGLLTL